MKALLSKNVAKIRAGSRPQFFLYFAPHARQLCFLLIRNGVLDLFLHDLSESEIIISIALNDNGRMFDYLSQLRYSVFEGEGEGVEGVLRNLETKRFFYGR